MGITDLSQMFKVKYIYLQTCCESYSIVTALGLKC
jgi:hypothetical protein